MRAVLVFPPKASPTYLPLGIASLVSYLQRQVPDCSLRALDTNIEVWQYLATNDVDGDALLRFMQGVEGDFYDSPTYSGHRQTWHRLSARISQLNAEARQYVATGAASNAFMALLDFQVEKILLSDPELIGLSIVFLDQVPFSLALARRVKDVNQSRVNSRPGQSQDSSLRIVLGGAAMSALRTDDLLAACPYVDGILVGEGEAGAAALCSGEPRDHVPGLVFRSTAGIKRNPNSLTLSLKCLPSPDFSMFDLHRYFNPVPVVPVLFSRGCAWRKCRFCVHNSSFGGYRTKTVDAFVSQLQDEQERYGVSHFYFADQYVGAADLERIADLILERELNIHFHVMARPHEDWSPERTEKLFRAGCRWICWGVESGSQRLLDLINKGTNVGTIERVLRKTAQSGISNLIMIILGLPTSNDLDLRLTFRFLEDVYDSADVISASSFVLWTRSHFGRNAGKYGLHVTGPRVLLEAGGRAIRLLRLDYSELSPAGMLLPPRGPVELAAWEDRRPWLGRSKFAERLPCEHYLLYVSRHSTSGSKPHPPLCRVA